MKKTKRMLSATCALLVLALCLPLASCVTRVSAAELSAGYTRSTTESGNEDDALYNALASFTFKMLDATMSDDGESIFISPYSIAMCLGMLTEGADGNTRAQLEALLGMSSDELSRALYAFTTRLCDADSPLAVADSLWIRNGFSVKSDFLQRNADWYGAQIYNASFGEETVNDINAWCSEHTDGMIKKIIDNIESDTVTYLINAVCFDAEWQNKYEKNDILDDIFVNQNGDERAVQMLHSSGETYISSDALEGFAKNYEGGDFSFVGLLPKDETADIFEVAADLDGESWLALWRERGGSADAGIPEFKLECSLGLNDALKSFGASDMFDGFCADFGRLSDEPTYCTEVGHKTFIELDRNGTRAAAVTWATNTCEAVIEEAKVVILDRPFICMIVDNASGIPIFVGVISDIG